MKEEVKEEAVKKEEKQEKGETKKKSKKGLIISLVIIVILIVIGASVGGYFLYKKYQLEKPIETAWGQTYYTYLKSVAESGNTEKINELNNGAKLNFYDVEDIEEPVMILSYEKDEENYSEIYFIEDGTINAKSYSFPTDVEMLYSIEEKEYNWYVTYNESKETEYIPVQNEINKSTGEKIDEESLPKEYEIKDGDKTTVETVDGKEISIDKFDETFIKPEIEDNSIDFSFNLIEEALKEAIENLVNDYKNKDQIITDEVKQNVADKETEILNKQKEMDKAEEEVEKKKEEEAKKKAEEEAKKKAEEGFKVGNYRLKYGTYKSDVYIMDSSMYGTITIRPDGTCHIKANCEGNYPYKKLDCEGTYKATRAIDSYEYYDAIEFTTDTGEKFHHEVNQNNAFSDQWHGYTYAGE